MVKRNQSTHDPLQSSAITGLSTTHHYNIMQCACGGQSLRRLGGAHWSTCNQFIVVLNNPDKSNSLFLIKDTFMSQQKMKTNNKAPTSQTTYNRWVCVLLYKMTNKFIIFVSFNTWDSYLPHKYLFNSSTFINSLILYMYQLQ